MILISNGIIHTMDDGRVIKNGYVLLDGARIAETGSGLPACANDPDVQTVDAAGGWVLPGLVDAHSHIGLFNDGLGEEGSDGNEATDPVTPHLRAVDAIYHADECFLEAARAGITTVMTGPGSANIFSGQFAVMKTAGRTTDEMLVRAPAAMKVALGENPKRVYGTKSKTPLTRMANASIFRETMLQAREYARKKRLSDPDKQPEPDMKQEALLPVLDGTLTLKIHVHRADDILTAVRICNEFGVRYTLDHCTEGYLVADVLKEEYERGLSDPLAGTGAGKGKLEGILVGPLLSDRSKPELMHQNIRNPGILAETGIPMAILTDHPVIPQQYLILSAAVAAREGMGEEAALRAVTIDAARLSGAADRVGSLEAGKDADVLILDGHPFDLRTRVLGVWINGAQVPGSGTL